MPLYAVAIIVALAAFALDRPRRRTLKIYFSQNCLPKIPRQRPLALQPNKRMEHSPAYTGESAPLRRFKHSAAEQLRSKIGATPPNAYVTKNVALLCRTGAAEANRSKPKNLLR